MKLLKVVVVRWLEVPEDWDLVEPEFTDQVHLATDNGRLAPELTWMALKDHSEETVGWQEVDVDLKERLGNMMTAGANTLEVDEDDEDDEDIEADES